MRLSFFILAITLFVADYSFSQESTNEQIVDKVSKPSSVIFKNTVYDYGTINRGDDGVSVFQFKNISKNDVTITKVRTSCGCAGAEWPQEPVRKKKTGEIKVTYDTNNIGKFHKTIYVNIDDSVHPVMLEIKGEVLPGPNNRNTDKEKVRGNK